MSKLTYEDVAECVFTLEDGDEYKFVLEYTGEFRPYVDTLDNTQNIIVVLTPAWYELTYCSNGWNVETLQNELNEFARCIKKLDDKFISTKFWVIWR